MMSKENTSAVHVWLIIMKAHNAMGKHAMRSIESTGLCFSDFSALEFLLHKGVSPINSLGEHLALTSGALTSLVDRLEKKGHVERNFDPKDRRVRLISLTNSGKELIETIFTQHSQDMEEAMTTLNIEERQLLIQLLKKAGKAAANKV